MSNRLKQLVEEIQKVAQEAPHRRVPKQGPPAGGGGAPTGGGAAPTGGAGGAPHRGQTGAAPHRGQHAPAGSGGGGGGYSNQGIKAMQVAIQDLAQTISNTIDYNSLMRTMQGPPAPPVQPGAADREQQAQFKAEYGKDFFSNFMVNQYLKNSNVHGVEYDTDPKRSKMLDKKPADLKAMFIILDSMKRIGSERQESFADGTWGPRTNNALRNVAAIADAVLKLGGDLGMQSNAFDTSKVAALDSMIPEKDTDINPQEKVQRAPVIANILKGVKALFLDFKQQVFMDPVYRNFIEGKTDMFSAGPKKGTQATEGEQPILADLQQNGFQSRYATHPAAQFQFTLPKEYVPAQYQNVTIRPFTINGGDLASPKFFDLWVAKNSVLANLKEQNPQTWPNVVKMVLDQVSAQIDQKLGATQQQGA